MNISEQYRVAVVSTGHVKKKTRNYWTRSVTMTCLVKVCSGSRKIDYEVDIMRISATEQWRVGINQGGISAQCFG
ncbi:hypothetical protein AB2G28_24470 (plasmid) [Escherichia coli]